MSVETIQSLALAPLDPPPVRITRYRGPAGRPSAAIDAGSIVAFAGGISAQDREDILYSIQFAQRAASAVADRYEAVEAWYKQYVDVLAQTGWVLNGFNLSTQQADESQVEVAKAALQILAAAAAGPASAVLLAAIEALKGMAKDDGYITLFEHYGAKGRVGNFQISDVQAGEGNQLSIVTGAFEIRMMERQEKFLFFTWNKEAISVWGDATRASFNRDQYARVREIIRSRLGVEAMKAIAEMPLAGL